LIYLEPLLFASLTSKNNVDHRISYWNYNKERELKVELNKLNNFYIPNLGWFYLDISCLDVTLKYNICFEVFSEMKKVNFKFESPILISEKFELLIHPIDLLGENFFDEFGKDVPVEITNCAIRFQKYLEKGVRIIEEFNPVWFETLSRHLKKIVLFEDKSGKRNSFATQSVHGCIFLNCEQDNYNEVFFIEDVAHQSGHVIFNAFLASDVQIFKVDKDLDIYLDIEKNEFNEPRAIYVVMHAMYTYECIISCFQKCLENNVFTDHKRHELIGRLTYTLHKFIRDYKLLTKKNSDGDNLYFTEYGEEILNWFNETFENCINEYNNIIKFTDITNQPYNFSYEEFLKLNPNFLNEN